jgi:hypothetical protein
MFFTMFFTIQYNRALYVSANDDDHWKVISTSRYYEILVHQNTLHTTQAQPHTGPTQYRYGKSLVANMYSKNEDSIKNTCIIFAHT